MTRTRSGKVMEKPTDEAAEKAFDMAEPARRIPDLRQAARAAGSLFTDVQPKALNGGLPELSPALAGMVETTFELADPEALYEELVAALDRRDALTPGVLREQLADSARLYREAHRLYIVARADYDRFESDFAVVEAALRDSATRELQKEKDVGLRSKQITDGDVRSRVADMFPDQWREMCDRKVRADKMIEHLKHLCEVFKVRSFALRTLCGSREEL
jgi:hypothetical protein